MSGGRHGILDRLARTGTHSTFPQGERDAAYTRSYRFIRLAVGVLGIGLPVIFIAGEAFALRGGVHLRGSLSAYYHTSMQDIFVAGLCIVGFLLITYLAGEAGSVDFWASLVAGIAVIGVVFFPTSRPDLKPGAPACEDSPTPSGCSFVEHALGESRTAVIHGVCAIVFIVGLAVMSFLFAHSEKVAGTPRRPRSRRLYRLHLALGSLILLAGLWVFVGGALHRDIGELTPLYTGEVVAVLAFGTSWLVAGFHLTAPPRVRTGERAGPAGEVPVATA